MFAALQIPHIPLQPHTCVGVMQGSVPAVDVDGARPLAGAALHKLPIRLPACQLDDLVHHVLRLVLGGLPEVEERRPAGRALQDPLRQR